MSYHVQTYDELQLVLKQQSKQIQNMEYNIASLLHLNQELKDKIRVQNLELLHLRDENYIHSHEHNHISNQHTTWYQPTLLSPDYQHELPLTSLPLSLRSDVLVPTAQGQWLQNPRFKTYDQAANYISQNQQQNQQPVDITHTQSQDKTSSDYYNMLKQQTFDDISNDGDDHYMQNMSNELSMLELYDRYIRDQNEDVVD